MKDEHGRLIENYNSLSVENLKLKDQVESLLKRLPDRHDKELKEVFVFGIFFWVNKMCKSCFDQCL